MKTFHMLLCLLGLHSWEYARTATSRTGGVRILERCRWCGWAWHERRATASEEAAWLALRDVGAPPAELLLKEPAQPVPPLLAYSDRLEHLRLVPVPGKPWAAKAPEQRPPRQFHARALGPNLRERVGQLRGHLRPDEVAVVVMEEGVGRAVPLQPRRWAVEGNGPMKEDDHAYLRHPDGPMEGAGFGGPHED